MITSLQIRNFKGWQNTTALRLAPITVFFGTNSSGKSSIGQFLMMLKQTANSTDRNRVLHPGDDKTPVDLGTFDDLLNQHDQSRELVFSLEWTPPKQVEIEDVLTGRTFCGSKIRFEATIGFEYGKGLQAICRRFKYKFCGEHDSMFSAAMEPDDVAGKYQLKTEGFEEVRKKGRGWPLSHPSRFFGFPDELSHYYQNGETLNDLAFALQNLLQGVSYLGPLREEPRRQYAWAGGTPEDVGSRGERWVSAFLSASERKIRLSGKKAGFRFDTLIANWLQRLGLIHSFTVAPVAKGLREYRVRVKVSANSPDVSITRDVQQRQALVRSGKFWVWSFSWEDIQFRNDPAKIPVSLLGETNAARRNEMARQVLAGDELALAQSAATYSSWSLFLEFLARPTRALWESIGFLYGLALPTQLLPVALTGATETVRGLCEGSVVEPGLPKAQSGDGLGAVFRADQSAGVTLVTQSGVKERSPNGVFLLLRFDDNTGVLDPGFARHWRGFLRLLNRLQFLPNAYVVTVRGCKDGSFPGIPDAYQYFLAGGEGARPVPDAHPETAGGFPADFDLAQPGILALLEQVLSRKLAWPAIGYELEIAGRVAATAEAAWPDAQIAVVNQEMAVDHETFLRAGWQVFGFGADGVAPQDTSNILSKLSSKP